MNKIINVVLLAFAGYILYALYNSFIITNLWHDVYYYCESWWWGVQHILK